VIKAALNRQVIAHTLMSVGVLAALAVGEWVTAPVVVFFMRWETTQKASPPGSRRRA
jgi:Cd2+/Zn2+-exporting ATPase/Cu+-exporting ATPase